MMMRRTRHDMTMPSSKNISRVAGDEGDEAEEGKESRRSDAEDKAG